MKHWLKYMLAGLVIVATVGAVVLAEAPATPAGPATGRPPAIRAHQEMARKAAELVRKLGITQAQLAQIREILNGSPEELAQLQKGAKVARLHLSLALEEGASGEKLTALIKECEAAAKALKNLREGQLRKAFAVLTVEQQARLIVTVGDNWWKLLLLRPGAPR